MPFSEVYRRQAALLVRLLPFVAQEDCFALKGGTAINLFHRDMPRLSVDLDLTYLPVAPRPESLAAIDAALKRIAETARSGSPAADITESPIRGEEAVTRLFARGNDVQIKIEVTPVLRGCVYEPELRTVSPAVEDAFGFAEMKVVSFADSMPARWWPRSTGSIRATCSTSAIFSRTRASTMRCDGPSSSTCSATTGP